MNSSPFDRLRIARPLAVLTAALGGGAAQAAPVSLPLNFTTGSVRYGASGTSYSGIATTTVPSMVVNANGDTITSIHVYGIGEASLFAGGSTLSNATITRADAFDRFAQIRVNGTFFTQPGGQVDLTTTGDGSFVTTLTPLNIGGIDTSLDYFMDNSSSTLRVLATFTNTTASSQSVEVLYGGNVGADEDTRLEATSSGDSTFQQADRWLISSDGGLGDPVLTFVRYGSGTVEAASDTLAVLGTPTGTNDPDYFTDVWNLNIDAFATESLMWFVQFNFDATSAQAGTGVFDDLTSLSAFGLLAAVNGGEIDTSNIVNWEPVSATAVPLPGMLPLMGLGLFGLAYARQRRSA